MSKKALLNIIGRQKYGPANDKIEMTTVGTIEENGENYIIRYKEEQEPPKKPINATVKISKDLKKVEMIRSGPYNSCLIIEKSKRNLCNYGTEYGNMLMGIYGKIIESDFNGSNGSFNFGYDIDINGALASKNEVTIDCRINQEI